jgi:hypothetical protein
MPRPAYLPLVVLVACAPHLRMPMTASQLAEHNDGGALVTYLGQRDATAAVCDLGAPGPHLASSDADARDELMSGLRERRIVPALWRDCVDRLARSSDPESAASLFDAVARSYAIAIDAEAIEPNPVIEEQLSMMQALLLDRRIDVAPHPETMTKLIEYLRGAIAQRKLGSVAMRFASELVADVELEHGTRGGRTVDALALDSLFTSGDEATLRHAALRLPEPRLRTYARRLIIRLHIQSSPFPQVRQNAAAVEETMMRLGSNVVVLTVHPPLRAWVDTSALAARGVRVRQDLRHHTNTLLGYAADGSGVSVLPQPSVRGMLHVALDGIDQPVTVCAPPEELDPSPCVPVTEVRLESRFVHLDMDGTLRFVEQLNAPDAMSVAASARRLIVPVSVGGKPLVDLDWELEFETPKDLVFDAGLDLHVRIDVMSTNRLGYAVANGDELYEGVVERSRAGSFRVISRGDDGANGSDGSPGHDGAPGSSGISATCPSTPGTDGARGQDGSAGQDGENGRPGGRGGNIVVDVMHGANSAALVALLQGSIRSEGGSGGTAGSGGAGGHGGAGGSGGSGATCTDNEGRVTTLSGGSSGPSGSDGHRGSSGWRGANGDPGQVTLRVLQ